jgi:putative transposase
MRQAIKRSRISEEQIIGILKEHQAGMSAGDLCRKHGISDATFYTWRKTYGGMEVLKTKRHKALEEENAKLKKLLAEQMMDVATLREMFGKNFWRSVQGGVPWTGLWNRRTTRRNGRSLW